VGYSICKISFDFGGCWLKTLIIINSYAACKIFKTLALRGEWNGSVYSINKPEMKEILQREERNMNRPARLAVDVSGA